MSFMSFYSSLLFNFTYVVFPLAVTAKLENYSSAIHDLSPLHFGLIYVFLLFLFWFSICVYLTTCNGQSGLSNLLSLFSLIFMTTQETEA